MANECTSANIISLKRIIMISFDKSTLMHFRATFEHRYDPEYVRAFADLYWRSLLLAACVVVAGAAIYGAIFFFDALPSSNTDTSATAPIISGGSNLDRAQLDATLNGFAARQEKFKSLQTGAIPPEPDPSQ